MAQHELCSLSLSDVAGMIRERVVSPVEVTEAVLNRTEQLNPRLNAFITLMMDEARRSAAEAEREIARGRYRGPLHGVPISVKDLVETRGVRTTAGSRILADYVPQQDAAVVRKLRAAGAVLFAKNNMLEFAYGEVHPDYGPTRNPWNVDYETSGSSSGSGAAVAAGLGYGSLGSDTGGSIRLPAAYCGIVGLKPSYDLVDRSGVVPLAWSLDHIGPMTRTVRDNAILLEAIAGVENLDPESAPNPAHWYADRLDEVPDSVRIGVVEPESDDEIEPDVRMITDSAAHTLRSLGFETTAVRLPHPAQAVRAVLAMFYAEASSFHYEWLRTRADEYSANTRERLELGALLPAHVYLRALRVRRVVIDEYQKLFREVDVLLMPTSPFTPARLDRASAEPGSAQGDRMAPLIRFTAPFDLTGLPALSVPAGLSTGGLPVGVQFVGRAFSEPLLFQVAHRFEHERATSVSRPRDNSLLV